MKRFVLILSIVFLGFILVACSFDPLTEAIKKIKLPKEVTHELFLPQEDESLGVSFEWLCDKADIIGYDGKVYLQDEDQEIILTVIASKDNDIKQKQFKVLVKATHIDAFIYAWDYFRPRIDSRVSRNYTRFKPDTYYNGASIRYESTNQNIITNEGIITQGLEDQVVIINCYLSYEGMVKLYKKEMTILKLSESAVINLVNTWIPEQVEAFKNGVINSLPTRHPEYGTYVRWTSTNPDVLVVDGHVLKTSKTSFVLNCEIILGSEVKKYYFPIEDFSGGTDEEVILNNWLPSLIPTKILGSKNFLKKDHLDYQIRTNVGGVLNELTGNTLNISEDLIGEKDEDYIGKVSSNRHYLSQEKLNELFYEGYQKPNIFDIIWVVVHESGMPYDDNNASLLNDIMHRKMISNPAQSSWHYSVDAYDIFHHIPNHLGAWHASDGSTVGGGNRNGIGIEMCINQDGNYEGALHNDAKLIAYLMHEYNLTLTNIRRHYDFAPDKKECPSYMIRTNRWNEFLDMVNREYIAILLLKNANVTWHHTHPELFIKGDNNLFYNKAVSTPTNVEVTLTVSKGSYQFNQTKTLILGGN